MILCQRVNTEKIKNKKLRIEPKELKQNKISFRKNSKKTFEDLTIADPKKRELLFGQHDHVRIYGQDYVNRLEESGFKVDRVNISNLYSEYGLNPDEDIFVGKK